MQTSVITVHVKTGDEKDPIAITLCQIAPVSQLKKKIEERLSIEPAFQEIYYRGELLEDCMPLARLCRRDAQVLLVQQFKAGGE